VLASLRAFLLPHHRLALETVALRQQLAVFKRKQPRPKLRRRDRIFWVALLIYGRAGPRPSSVALHGRYSASQLCHELRLSAGALRSRLAETVSEKPSSRPAFVPVHTEACNWSAPTVPLVSVAEIRLVWERADGTRLHLSLPASQWTQAEALCTAFLRS